jgi:DNA (cytosine-5)-methyltransferase 1
VRVSAGSLCTGIGGLDLAVEAHFGAELAWYAEVEPAPCTVLEREWPGVPNVGDLTAVDWSGVEPVDVLTAGYPCQPFSHAGKRKGSEDVRHLWPFIAEAVRVLRPRWVVLENVAGHLTLGFGDVLRDLAEAGFDAEWCLLRASDVGAPHRRERLFVVATDASGAGAGRNVGAVPRQAQEGRRAGADVRPAVDDGAAPTAATDLGHERCGDAWGRWAGSADRDRPDADTAGGGEQDGSFGCDDLQFGAVDRAGDRDRPGSASEGVRHLGRTAGVLAWGPYEPAIRRWEVVLGRPAPAPTDDRGRLSPPFVEWMMGYPEGWTAGLTRTQALKALGNAVVPQQGLAALRELAPVMAVAA